MRSVPVASTGLPLSVEEIRAERERRAGGEQLREEADRLAGSLRGFMRAAWHVIEPADPFRDNWHLDAICDHLEAVYDRDIRRLLINVPPRTTKSTSVTVLAPVWRWTTEPAERFLTASYADPLATEHAVKSRRLIESAWYRARWGHLYRLTTDQNTKTWYENDRTGYRIATSVGGSGTGRGGSVIVVDDPHNANDVLSDAKRKAAIEWHNGTIATRFNDPQTGVEIVVMQRLHEHDLAGELLQQGGWTHLVLPAEYERRLVVTLPDKTKLLVTAPAEVVLPNGRVLHGDPRTQDGELLDPERNPPVEHERTKGTLGSYKAAGQLQQRPTPAEGGLLKRAWWRFYPPNEPPTPGQLVQSWDTSWKDKKTSDYVVGHLWGTVGARRYLLRRVKGQWDLAEGKTQIRMMAAWAEENYPGVPMRVLIENTANGPEIIAEIRRTVQGVIPVNPKGDKTQRALAVQPQLEAGDVWVPGVRDLGGLGYDAALTPVGTQELIDEAAAFPGGSHDDDVDAMTQALRYMRTMSTGTATRDDGDDGRQEERKALGAGVLTETF